MGKKIKQNEAKKIKKVKTKRTENKGKTRMDLGRIAIKVIAAILAIIMVVAVAGTLIYYLTIS